MNEKIQTMIFSVVLAVVCSGLLVGSNQLTASYRAANEKAEEVKNVLSVLNVPVPEGAKAEDLLKLFAEKVVERKVGEVSLFEYGAKAPGEKPDAVAVYFSGPGLWGPIHGVMALEADLTTIRGISFYKQEETPGLGGEIGGPAFQSKFAKKKMISDDEKSGFLITKPGMANGSNQVDGISGATMTCDRVHIIVDALAKKLEGVRGAKSE